MARSKTTRSTNPKIMDDNIKILDVALAGVTAPEASDVSYDNTDSGLTANDVQAAIDEVVEDGKLNTFEITPLNDSTWSIIDATVNEQFVRIIATVSLDTDLTAGSSVNIGSISDTNVLSKIPQGVTVRAFSFYSTTPLAVFIGNDGTIGLRNLGASSVPTVSFNLVF